MEINLTLFSPSEAMCDAWSREFDAIEAVTVENAWLSELDHHDCLVSPANSFGIMDGGIDLAIRDMMPEVQRRVSSYVAERYFGEQPVGTSLIVPTGSDLFPWLAHTPTMRFPRPITGEIAYDATRAMLIAVLDHNAERPDNRISSIACPGMGTGTGNIGAFTAAHMMRLAYESIMLRAAESYDSWDSVGDHIHALTHR